MKKISKIKAIIVINLLCCCICCCFVYIKTKEYYQNHIKNIPIRNVMDNSVESIIEKEVVVSGATIQSELNNIGKLCTAEYYYTHVEHYENSKEIKGVKIPLTSSKFIYSYDGKILAGIDFHQITVDKDDNTKKITVTLPCAEILSSDVDQDSFQLYDEKNNIFNPFSVTDMAVSFADLKNNEEEKAIAGGLYDRAKTNATSLVENFMKVSYNIEDYKIIVTFEQEP
ncbi:MAG: DUF4230 domain-containing protein [Lachnospiraceae bacterium]|nr:DUF4230 domain-containing protein [Lachnospiraceae bacterium]